jgi:hypothetical protein
MFVGHTRVCILLLSARRLFFVHLQVCFKDKRGECFAKSSIYQSLQFHMNKPHLV